MIENSTKSTNPESFNTGRNLFAFAALLRHVSQAARVRRHAHCSEAINTAGDHFCFLRNVFTQHPQVCAWCGPQTSPPLRRILSAVFLRREFTKRFFSETCTSCAWRDTVILLLLVSIHSALRAKLGINVTRYDQSFSEDNEVMETSSSSSVPIVTSLPVLSSSSSDESMA